LLWAEGFTDIRYVDITEAHVRRADAENSGLISAACCWGHREFARNHPVATKRVIRAILKVVDLCAKEPDRVARRMVDRGSTPRYDYARQTLSDVPYD
jgi:NitT/TauT family transport system substrate-binding protein